MDKDETVEVAVQCSYSNPNNHFPEFMSLILSNYPLTLPYNLQKFSVDKTELVTDDQGSASFNVTALEEGSEFVKVQFYVPGPFGEYSASYVKFICGGDYTFEGHMTETRSGDYTILRQFVEEDFVSLKTVGTFEFNLNYDFKGAIILNEDGSCSGSLDIFNVEMSYDCTKNTFEGSKTEDHVYTHVKIDFELYEDEPWIDVTMPVSFNFTAAVAEDFACTLAAKSSEYFAVALMFVHIYEHVDSYGGTSLHIK